MPDNDRNDRNAVYALCPSVVSVVVLFVDVVASGRCCVFGLYCLVFCSCVLCSSVLPV